MSTVEEEAPVGELTTREIILRGIEVINNQGWVQGHYSTKDGRHCVMGALRAAVNYTQPIMPAVDAIKAVTGCSSITVWNDLPTTTVEEVIRVMTKAAKACEPSPELGAVNGA